MLYISTSVLVLRTPIAGQGVLSHVFLHFHKIWCKMRQKRAFGGLFPNAGWHKNTGHTSLSYQTMKWWTQQQIWEQQPKQNNNTTSALDIVKEKQFFVTRIWKSYFIFRPKKHTKNQLLLILIHAKNDQSSCFVRHSRTPVSQWRILVVVDDVAAKCEDTSDLTSLGD